ncbi:Dynamin-like GTPase that mediates homotypic ER fusion [Apophysomyces ossiformis]|uniref:Dynamin-like GTPase that mediates homotypic ER fusion n=1 Tax=Apophysomyces ossiformis TaxID=679940 RepID=A0A8H7ER04_9FUNG|nr:Dynamin-like GTPase that mediates homotypic ER fusion [Apophysomyces ossiformis]
MQMVIIFTISRKIANNPTGSHENEEATIIPHLQLVDEHGNFTLMLPRYMDQWGLDNAGHGHHVVSIVGSQSSGKSTLLNELFDTPFEVMDPKKRCRTTKGIWMSRGKGMSSLILDLEGADSFDRDEDAGFENKSTLFALAISDVMILNLWECQIGLRGSVELLRTVFEVNLQLFQGSLARHKTLLMIIIRDYQNETPLEHLKNIVEETFDQIWSRLPRPRDLENCRMGDYFDAKYIALPNRNNALSEFKTEVAQLRQRFKDPNDENYVFRPCYFKCSTADRYDTYVSNIWKVIWTNRDLDLATRRVSISESRCAEILENALAEFEQKIQGVKQSLQNDEIIQDHGEQLESHLNDAMRTYDHNASYYDQRVYQGKREVLLEQISSKRQTCFSLHLTNLRRKAIIKFKDDMRAVLSQDSYDFNEALTTCFSDCDGYFNTYSRVVGMSDNNLSYGNQYELFMNELNMERRACEQEEERRQEREQQARRAEEERLLQAEQEHEERLRQAEQEHRERENSVAIRAGARGAIAGAGTVIAATGTVLIAIATKNPTAAMEAAKQIARMAVL